MIYCAYCGKKFTRKEHLERHLPTHTNVKPYRCTECQLAFSRRDLLQRHYNTYHQPKSPMGTDTGDVKSIEGPNRIACTECSQAKTGCDKQEPCGRCREKNLPCKQRFAKRLSKKANIRRANAAASTSANGQTRPAPVQPATPASVQLPLPSPSPALVPTAVTTSFINMDPSAGIYNMHMKATAPHDDTLMSTDNQMKLYDGGIDHMSPIAMHISPANFGHTQAPDIGGVNEAMQVGADYTIGNELPGWESYFDNYGNGYTVSMDPIVDISIPPFPDYTPNSTPNLEQSSSAVSTPLSVHSPNPVDGAIPEFEAMMVAESGWPLVRCNPVRYSGSCPRTARIHLECLEQKLRQVGVWTTLAASLETARRDNAGIAAVVPMTGQTRDSMLAIAQTFLHKALDIHREGPPDRNHRYRPAAFLTLPPSGILDYFLQNYARNLSLFYSLVSTSRVDPNQMIEDNQTSTLLVLLMIAQGASVVPIDEARVLSTGLIETCRISLLDIVEKNVEMCADPTVHRSALLFTLSGAWSGDKWLMDIAMGQRGMYISMLTHAGMFESQQSWLPTTSYNDVNNREKEWRSWLEQETKNRLVYNWVMVDQELSLFHDTAPMLATSKIYAPLPGPEQLWASESADQWVAAVQAMSNLPADAGLQQLRSTPALLTPSLSVLFQEFVCDNTASQQMSSLTPCQLRLLLHPLHALQWHQQEISNYFANISNMPAMSPIAGNSNTNDNGGASNAQNNHAGMRQQHDVQSLLQKWFRTVTVHLSADPTCVASMTNLVLYHLIALNGLTNFPAIEALARLHGSIWEQSPGRAHCIRHGGEAVYHCGQVIRLIRTIPANRLPVWWSAAVYRAIMILWADSILRKQQQQSSQGGIGMGLPMGVGGMMTGSSQLSPIAIDQVGPEDPGLWMVWNHKGTAVLSNPNGTNTNLDNPPEILTFALNLLGSGAASRFTDGIKRKIGRLAQAWGV